MERNFSLRSNSNEFLKKSIFVSFQTRIKVYLKRRLLSTNQKKKKILPKCRRVKIIIIIFFFQSEFLYYTGGLKKCHLDLNSSHALA